MDDSFEKIFEEIPLDDEENVQVTDSSPRRFEDESNGVRWTTNDIKLLLDIRLGMESEFRKGERNRNTLWNIVFRKILEKKSGFKFSAKEIKRKFNNMIITYRRIKLRNGKSGRGALHWNYYHEFDEVYGSRHDIDAPREIIFESNCDENSAPNNEHQRKDDCFPVKKKRKIEGSNIELLKYLQEEDEKEEKRHKERMGMEEKRNEIEKEKNFIEKEKTEC